MRRRALWGYDDERCAEEDTEARKLTRLSVCTAMTRGFASQAEMDEWLMDNMNTTNIGVTFTNSLVPTWSDANGEFKYELMVNTTTVRFFVV